MLNVNPDQISKYRAQTFRSAVGFRLTTAEEAVRYVNERGFISFWPIKGIEVPSLWVAAAGDRPVPDEHDDPGHVTWQWKDSLLGKQRWYYGRVIRKRNTMISLALLPCFYALSPNYGEPEQDYMIEYEQGTMAAETKQVYETLLREGPLDSLTLRKAARLTGEAQYNRAIDALQLVFRVCPVGVSDRGAWHYTFVYDCTHRHYATLVEDARMVSEHEARQKIMEAYLKSVGAVRIEMIEKVLHWGKPILLSTIEHLVRAKKADRIEVVGQTGEWIAGRALLEG